MDDIKDGSLKLMYTKSYPYDGCKEKDWWLWISVDNCWYPLCNIKWPYDHDSLIMGYGRFDEEIGKNRPSSFVCVKKIDLVEEFWDEEKHSVQDRIITINDIVGKIRYNKDELEEHQKEE